MNGSLWLSTRDTCSHTISKTKELGSFGCWHFVVFKLFWGLKMCKLLLQMTGVYSGSSWATFHRLHQWLTVGFSSVTNWQESLTLCDRFPVSNWHFFSEKGPRLFGPGPGGTFVSVRAAFTHTHSLIITNSFSCSPVLALGFCSLACGLVLTANY